MLARLRKKGFQARSRRSLPPKCGSILIFFSAAPTLWGSIHTAEVFPLMIAIAAALQSIIFLGVQSTALRTFWASGCDKTAQLMWPGMSRCLMIEKHALICESGMACSVYRTCLQPRVDVSIASKSKIPAKRQMARAGQYRDHSLVTTRYMARYEPPTKFERLLGKFALVDTTLQPRICGAHSRYHAHQHHDCSRSRFPIDEYYTNGQRRAYCCF